MSSGNHETGDSFHAAECNAYFTTLYMEGQPHKPALNQHWLTEIDLFGGLPAQAQRFAGDWSYSLLFHALPLSDQSEALPPQQHFLSMETYNQGGNGSASKGASSSPTYSMCDKVSAAACVPLAGKNRFLLIHYCVASMASLRPAVAAAESGAHDAFATGSSAVGNLWGAEATTGGNPWALSLVTTHSLMRPSKEVMMSSVDHETGDSCIVVQ